MLGCTLQGLNSILVFFGVCVGRGTSCAWDGARAGWGVGVSLLRLHWPLWGWLSTRATVFCSLSAVFSDF